MCCVVKDLVAVVGRIEESDLWAQLAFGNGRGGVLGDCGEDIGGSQQCGNEEGSESDTRSAGRRGNFIAR